MPWGPVWCSLRVYGPCRTPVSGQYAAGESELADIGRGRCSAAGVADLGALRHFEQRRPAGGTKNTHSGTGPALAAHPTAAANRPQGPLHPAHHRSQTTEVKLSPMAHLAVLCHIMLRNCLLSMDFVSRIHVASDSQWYLSCLYNVVSTCRLCVHLHFVARIFFFFGLILLIHITTDSQWYPSCYSL